MNAIRVVVVDDSPLIRRLLVEGLAAQPGIVIVGEAADGSQALEVVARTNPDVVTLDVEMPVMDGLTFLERQMRVRPLPVVMCSSRTEEGSAATLRALELGAIDFVRKPTRGLASLEAARRELAAKVVTAAKATPRPRLAGTVASARPAVPPAFVSDKVVLVASSTGGPRALMTLLEELPAGFGCPMVIVQHLPDDFAPRLATRLDSVSPLQVALAEHGRRPTPGTVLLAPGGKHLRFRTGGDLELVDGPSRHGVKPAADELFESAAAAFGPRCIGVILTGMGRDGTAGAQRIRKVGGVVIAEDESTCAVFGMPRAAIDAEAVDTVVPLFGISAVLMDAARGRPLAGRRLSRAG